MIKEYQKNNAGLGQFKEQCILKDKAPINLKPFPIPLKLRDP